MPGLFNITTPVNHVDLDVTRSMKKISFTVTNTSDQLVRGRALLVTEDPAVQPWLALVGDADRDFAVAATESYEVQIKVPPTVPKGNYLFRLDMLDTQSTDEHREQGPGVVIKVPAPIPPIPWIPIGIGLLVLLVVIGIIIFILTRPPAVATFAGDWKLNFGTMHLDQNGSQIDGTFHNQFVNRDGQVHGTVKESAFSGTWGLNGGSTQPLALTLDSAGTAITGQAEEFGTWCGAKGNAAFPPGCTFAGVWTTQLDGSAFTMTLTVVFPHVTGTYQVSETPTLSGTIDGNIQFSTTQTTTLFNGTYTVLPVGTPAARTGNIQLFTDGVDALQFQGNWADPGTPKSGEWCGERAGQPAPSPCLRR